jgi:hypothetical protein
VGDGGYAGEERTWDFAQRGEVEVVDGSGYEKKKVCLGKSVSLFNVSR